MSEPGSQEQPDEALVDLLIKQVTEGLSPAEQRALDVLDSARASEHLRAFERAAAAISLAGSAPLEPLPPALQEQLERQGQTHLAAAGGGATVAEFKAPRPAAPSPGRAARSASLAWFAAAACLVLAIFSWVRPPQVSPPPAADVHVAVPPPMPPPVETPQAPPTPAEERLALLGKTDSLKVTLAATKDPAGRGVTGDVVWDPVTQKGYLHFVGLAPNDPQVHQYQVWIFDGARDKRYPVDGGVFDVPGDATEVVIPINAKLLVHKPAAFAVTVEKPGGTVVSAREHVVALGATG